MLCWCGGGQEALGGEAGASLSPRDGTLLEDDERLPAAADADDGEDVLPALPAPSKAGLPPPAAPAEASAQRRVADLVLPGTAAVARGMAQAFGEVYQNKVEISEAMINWMFEDAVVASRSGSLDALSRSGSQDAEASPQPGAASPGTVAQEATPKSPAGGSSPGTPSTRTSVRGPTSLRVVQRRGQDLGLFGGNDPEPEGFITQEPMGPGDAESLVTRRSERVSVVDDRLRCVETGGTRVAAFGFHCQLAALPWAVPMHAFGIQDGLLRRISEHVDPGAEGFPKLGSAFPHLASLLRQQLFSVPEATLKTKRLEHGCVEVQGVIPFNLPVVEERYPSVHRILKMIRSATVRITRAPPTEEASAEAPMQQAVELFYDEGEVRCRFLVCGRYIAWADQDWQPVLEAGKVAVVESPVECPGKELAIYLRIRDGRLKLTNFGCVGLSSVPLPDMTLRLGITTEPPAGAPAPADGEAREEVPMTADIKLRLIDVAPFPAEMLVRPLFDVKLMRVLLAHTLEVGWIVRPCGSSTRWQIQVNVNASIPPVARAFRSCFRAFVSFQVAQMHFIELASELFAAAGQDFERIEADNAARSRAVADAARPDDAPDARPRVDPQQKPVAVPEAAAEARNRERKQTPWSGPGASGSGKKGSLGCGLRLRCFRR